MKPNNFSNIWSQVLNKYFENMLFPILYTLNNVENLVRFSHKISNKIPNEAKLLIITFQIFVHVSASELMF